MRNETLVKTLAVGATFALVSCGSADNTPSDVKVIYGEDGRSEIYENSADSLEVKLAKSTAIQIKKEKLGEPVNGVIKIKTETFNGNFQKWGKTLCDDEPYRDQPAAGGCSGFLVGPDTYVTAGHCIRTETTCEGAAFVFGAGYITRDSDPTSAKEDNVFYCKEIIKQVLDNTAKIDFAVIKLDRKVEGRTPLKFRTEGKITDKTPVTVIGHPSGLPTKITKGGAVRKNTDENFFQGNLDTYGGNSGSAVFDAKTGIVEGILVRGEKDFIPKPGIEDSEKQCYISNKCPDDGCRGEDVTRATLFAEYVK